MSEILLRQERIDTVVRELGRLRARVEDQAAAICKTRGSAERYDQLMQLHDQLWELQWLLRTGETYSAWVARQSRRPADKTR